MNVVWRALAIAQLRSIHSYIARDNPRAADAIVTAVETTAGDLGVFPYIGLATNRPNVYTKLVVGTPYRIFYRIAEAEVLIIRVRDARRRPLAVER